MEKFLLSLLVVLTAVLALAMLNELQHLPLNEETARAYWHLTAFGYGSAMAALLSGGALALLFQK